MRMIFQFDMRVFAPTKTTTGVSLECLGVKVERSAGSVQRALEEALTEFAHQLRAPLLKEARAARAETVALEATRTVREKDMVPEVEEPAGILPSSFVLPPISHEELEALTGPRGGLFPLESTADVPPVAPEP